MDIFYKSNFLLQKYEKYAILYLGDVPRGENSNACGSRDLLDAERGSRSFSRYRANGQKLYQETATQSYSVWRQFAYNRGCCTGVYQQKAKQVVSNEAKDDERSSVLSSAKLALMTPEKLRLGKPDRTSFSMSIVGCCATSVKGIVECGKVLNTMKRTPKSIPIEELRECYLVKGMSIKGIAEYYDVNYYSLHARMYREGISSRRSQKEPPKQPRYRDLPDPVLKRPPREVLYELYVNQELSLRQIGLQFDLSQTSIWNALEYYGIPLRRQEPNLITPDQEDQIIDCYVNKELSINAISKQFDMPPGSINRLLKNRSGKLRQPTYTPNPERGARDLYKNYRNGAIARGYSLDITFEYFKCITQQDCFYCGIEPKQSIWDYIYNGIDRIDNALGYTPDNSRPCCRTCNVAKRNLTEQEFYAWIDRLVAYRLQNTGKKKRVIRNELKTVQPASATLWDDEVVS